MNCLRIYNISIDSSRKILVFQTYPSTRPFRHIQAFFYLSFPYFLFLLSFPAFFSYCHSHAFFIVIPRLERGIYKIQGTVLRYVRKKQRASTKVFAAAGNAVKLATACQQTRATVRVSTDLTPAFFMAKAHSLRVDPVVITSSINTMRLFLRRSGCRTLKAFLTLEIRA